jgi:hypothetical protein
LAAILLSIDPGVLGAVGAAGAPVLPPPTGAIVPAEAPVDDVDNSVLLRWIGAVLGSGLVPASACESANAETTRGFKVWETWVLSALCGETDVSGAVEESVLVEKSSFGAAGRCVTGVVPQDLLPDVSVTN